MWSSIIELFTSSTSWITAQGIQDTLTKAMSNVFISGNAISKIYSAFTSIGLLLILVYFAMDIFDKLSSENFTIDVLMLDMVKIIAGVALINNGLYIVQGLVGMSDYISEYVISGILANTVPDVSGTTGDLGDDTWSIIGNVIKIIIEEAFAYSKYSLNLLESMIIGVVAMIATQIIAYERAILLAIRTLLSPFIFADIVGHGLSNKAMHHIKSIFAICLEGPIIILAVAFVNQAVGDSYSVAFSGIILVFATVKLMFGANQIAKEIVGG